MADRTLYPFADRAPEESQVQTQAIDYSMLQGLAMRANSAFENNVAQVKKGYDNILNAPVTGEEAQQRKQGYIKTAQSTIKQVASSDLSNPQNVLQAESAYKPFWEDQDLLTNISLTKYYQGESSKLDSWKDSTDATVRNQYSDYSKEDIQNQLEDLGNAPLDRNAYSKLSKRGAVPFADIPTEVKQQYEKEKNEGVETIDIIGDGVMTHHNGIKSLPSFRTYVASRFGDKYDQQLKVVADVLERRQRNEIKKYHPEMSDIQISQQSAKENIDHITKGYSTMRDNYQSVADDWNNKIKILENQKKLNRGVLNEVQQQELDLAKSQKKAYEDEALNYQQQLDKSGLNDVNSNSYKNMFNELAEHPSDYIWQIRKNQQIDEIATGMSNINVKESYTLNPVADAYHKNLLEQNRINVEASRVNAENYKTNSEYRQKTGVYEPGHPKEGQHVPGWSPDWGGTGGNSGTGKAADGSAVKAGSKDDITLYPDSATPEGVATVDEAKVPLDNIQKIQNDLNQDIHDKIYRSDGTGLLSILKDESFVQDGKTVTIDKQDLNNIESLALKMSKGIVPDNNDDEKLKSWSKLKQVLLKNGIINNGSEITGPGTMQGALQRFTQQRGNELIHATPESVQGTVNQMLTQQYGDLSKLSVKKLKELKESTTSLILDNEHKKGSQYVVTAEELQQKMQIANKNQETLKNITAKVLSSSPEYSKVNVNGNIIGIKDIATAFEDITAINDDGKAIRLSKEDLAQAFNDNTLEINPIHKQIKINNKVYQLPGHQMHDQANWLLDFLQYSADYPEDEINERFLANLKNKVEKLFGTSKEFNNLKTEVQQKVMSSLKGDNSTGFIYNKSSYSPSDPMQRTMAEGIGKEIGNTGISPEILTEDGQIVDSKLAGYIRQYLKDPADINSNVATFEPIHTPDNREAIRVTFKPAAITSLQDATAGVITTKIPDASYVFPIASKENAPTLKLLKNKQNFVYDDLYDCTGKKAIKSTPQADAYGQSFKAYGIRPDNNGKATYVQVTYHVTLPDDQNPGKMLPPRDIDYEIPLQGDMAKNPDEIMKQVYNIQKQFIDLANSTIAKHSLNISNSVPEPELLKK